MDDLAKGHLVSQAISLANSVTLIASVLHARGTFHLLPLFTTSTLQRPTDTVQVNQQLEKYQLGQHHEQINKTIEM